MSNRIEIPLENGYKLVAEKTNCPTDTVREIYICIKDPNGCFLQDLALVRQATDDALQPIPELFNVLVWGKENEEDFTEDFDIPMYKED